MPMEAGFNLFYAAADCHCIGCQVGEHLLPLAGGEPVIGDTKEVVSIEGIPVVLQVHDQVTPKGVVLRILVTVPVGIVAVEKRQCVLRPRRFLEEHLGIEVIDGS